MVRVALPNLRKGLFSVADNIFYSSTTSTLFAASSQLPSSAASHPECERFVDEVVSQPYVRHRKSEIRMCGGR